MALTVITITNAPYALRGDLTKWMQEIATGVYVGNLSTRIRESLWERVIENVGKGEATLAYTSRNEIGYQFETYQTLRSKIEIDGLPLVFIPKENSKNEDNSSKGFSNASKFSKARKFSSKSNNTSLPPIVIIDIETDGLNTKSDRIIEIGALKIVDGVIEEFSQLIKIDQPLKKEIIELTGITDDLLNKGGREIQEVLIEFTRFIEDLPLIGYNIKFDLSFIDSQILREGLEQLKNARYDLLRFIKDEKMFLKSYKLENVLKEYGINRNIEHRALSDAYNTYELLKKVNKLLELINEEC